MKGSRFAAAVKFALCQLREGLVWTALAAYPSAELTQEMLSAQRRNAARDELESTPLSAPEQAEWEALKKRLQ